MIVFEFSLLCSRFPNPGCLNQVGLFLHKITFYSSFNMPISRNISAKKNLPSMQTSGSNSLRKWMVVNITQKNHVFSALCEFAVLKVFCLFYTSAFGVLFDYYYFFFMISCVFGVFLFLVINPFVVTACINLHLNVTNLYIFLNKSGKVKFLVKMLMYLFCDHTLIQ